MHDAVCSSRNCFGREHWNHSRVPHASSRQQTNFSTSKENSEGAFRHVCIPQHELASIDTSITAAFPNPSVSTDIVLRRSLTFSSVRVCISRSSLSSLNSSRLPRRTCNSPSENDNPNMKLCRTTGKYLPWKRMGESGQLPLCELTRFKCCNSSTRSFPETESSLQAKRKISGTRCVISAAETKRVECVKKKMNFSPLETIHQRLAANLTRADVLFLSVISQTTHFTASKKQTTIEKKM